MTLLIVFTNMMRNVSGPINQLAGSLGSIFSALASAERVLEILKLPIEIDKPEDRTLDPTEVYGLIEAENLNFSYVKDKPILKNINFLVKPKEVVALVGPTGAGKTTIVNLITRFYDIDSGNLLIDGHPINTVKRESLRKNITMVLQDTYLFSDNILENIRYGRLDATDEEVKQAARLAYADNFIMQLPKGYETILEDNGSNLSLGQRQLIAISRAFLSNAKIVILDEATSSIDTKTELLIQKSMSKLIEDKTAFVIAHRLSTIMHANQILVIRDGTIVERGTHQELLDKNGFYADLFNSQFKKGMEI
jgi:ATP-binding cassette subfamily B protein